MRINHSLQTLPQTLKGIVCEVAFAILYIGVLAACLGAVILVPR